MITVLHNTKCSKSRECLLFLEQSGQQYEIVEYLKQPPTAEELQLLIQRLGIKPIELIRRKEAIWKEKFEGKTLRSAQIIRAMVRYPILIERPIVIKGDNAVIARPLELAAKVMED